MADRWRLCQAQRHRDTRGTRYLGLCTGGCSYAELLEPFPGVQIVLSTAWVCFYGCANTAKRLPTALRRRVVGATFHSRMDESVFAGMPRGQQVWRDVVRRDPKDWLALDDDHEDWPAWCLNNFVQTRIHEGISDLPVLTKIKEKLAKLGAEE